MPLSFSQVEAPPTGQLFDDMHQRLGLRRVPAHNGSSDHKARIYAMADTLLYRFAREELAPLEGKDPGITASLAGLLRTSSSHKEVVNHLLEASGKTLHPLLSGFYWRYRGILEYGGPDPDGTSRMLGEAESLIAQAMPLAGRFQEPKFFLWAALEGLNTQLGVESGVLDVIPRVAREKYDSTLSVDEYATAARGAVGLLRSLSKTHLNIFEVIMQRCQPDQLASLKAVPTGGVLPYITDPFVFTRPGGRLQIGFSQEFMRQVEQEVQDTRTQKKILTSPLVGCPAASIVPAVHRLVYGLVGPAMAESIDHLSEIPRLAVGEPVGA